MNGKMAMINVGVNKFYWKKYHLASPLFEDDGSYAYVPIPEEGRGAYPQCPLLPSYAELFKDNKRVLNVIPKVCHDKRVHNDPEFETYTYGDNPHRKEEKGKAGGLMKLELGDFLFFFGRLTKIRDGRVTNEAAFFFFGFFEIQQLEPKVVKTSRELLQVYGNNAHVKRGIADQNYFNDFWVCRGSKNSQQFKTPVPFNRELTMRIVKFDRNGRQFAWSEEESDFRIQQGGCTRSCRFIDEGDGGKEVLLKHVLRYNKVPLFSQLLGQRIN